MTTVLLTGANGFVGKAVSQKMIVDGWRVRGVVRSREAAGQLPDRVEAVIVDAIGPDTDWLPLLKGVDVIIHLAARVHVMDDKAVDPLSEFRRVNTTGTQRLARAAASAGVSRLVYLSSVKVNGERTDGRRFTEQDQPKPEDAYAASKWEAEQSLMEIGKQTSLEVVLIRPPLVYGPGVKGNFLRLLRLVDRSIPLPLGSVANRRSLVALDNLTGLITLCAVHPKAAGECFLVADGEDVSTAELVRRLAEALGRPARLLPFPPGLLRWAARLTGKGAAADRLLGSLQIDVTKAKQMLGWSPSVTVDEGIGRTASWYRKCQQQ